MVKKFHLHSNQPWCQSWQGWPKNTSAFTRASNTLAKKSCNYLDQDLLIRNSKNKKKRSVFQLKNRWQVGATESRQKNTLKTYFFWPNGPLKGRNQPHMLLFASVEEARKNGKKELFLIELVTFFFEKTTARKISKNDNQTYLRTSKQSAVTAKHERNFPQPVITTIQERRKKFVRETIDFSNFLYGLPLSWWIVVCHRRCQLTVFPLFHTPAYLVPYLVSTIA